MIFAQVMPLGQITFSIGAAQPCGIGGHLSLRALSCCVFERLVKDGDNNKCTDGKSAERREYSGADGEA